MIQMYAKEKKSIFCEVSSVRRFFVKNFVVMRSGFTLLELIMVTVLVGILAFVAVPRMPNMAVIRLDFAAQKMQSDIRYAQSLAVSSQRWTRLVFNDAGDNYSISIDGIDDGVSNPGSWVTVLDPLTNNNFVVQLNSGDFVGVDLTQVIFNGSNNQLVFDKWGNPYSYGGAGGVTVLSNPSRVRVSSSSGVKDIFVERGTGRVSIQ